MTATGTTRVRKNSSRDAPNHVAAESAECPGFVRVRGRGCGCGNAGATAAAPGRAGVGSVGSVGIAESVVAGPGGGGPAQSQSTPRAESSSGFSRIAYITLCRALDALEK